MVFPVTTDVVFKIKPKPMNGKGEFYFSTCHRNTRFKGAYEYKPNSIEATDYCPVVLTYAPEDHKRGLADVQEAFLDFGASVLSTSPEVQKSEAFDATLLCNGESRAILDVGVCQGKVGTLQDILFASPVIFGPPAAKCAGLALIVDSRARITLPKGYCVFTFREKASGRILRLTTYGYDSWRP